MKILARTHNQKNHDTLQWTTNQYSVIQQGALLLLVVLLLSLITNTVVVHYSESVSLVSNCARTHGVFVRAQYAHFATDMRLQAAGYALLRAA